MLTVTADFRRFNHHMCVVDLGVIEYPNARLGGIKGAMVDGQWTWITDGQTIAYDLWHPNQPDGSGNCLQVWAKVDRDPRIFGFEDGICANKKSYICESYVPYVFNFTLLVIYACRYH
jgi:hypothetical protein